MHTLALLCINQQTKFKVPTFTISRNIMGQSFKKTVTWLRPRLF